jgi:hypothetical protein
MVQTGNLFFRMNRAHGLQCVGKEEGADGETHSPLVLTHQLALRHDVTFHCLQ